jgi:hypothetical protein
MQINNQLVIKNFIALIHLPTWSRSSRHDQFLVTGSELYRNPDSQYSQYKKNFTFFKYGFWNPSSYFSFIYKFTIEYFKIKINSCQ